MIRDAVIDAWALLFPVECAGCETEGRALCGACAAALLPDATARQGPDGLRVHTALRYEGTVRRVLLAYKEHGRTDVTPPLARALAHAVAVARVPGAELLPVPTSRAAYRRRGYDPVRRLLRSAGLQHETLLTQGRRTGTQKALGVDARAANLRGAFVARRHVHGRTFLLVDDVLTSGATIGEAARAVRAAGGDVVGAATLAFTPRLLPFSDKSGGAYYGGGKGA